MSESHNLSHNPVLLQEMLDYLQPKDGGFYIDGTFGAGGYSQAILAQANCELAAIDQDPSAHKFADILKLAHSQKFNFIAGNFANMLEIMAQHNLPRANGIVLDLGVSSMQLDQADRGFSFMYDGPLDMRMNQSGMSASELVNQAGEEELADIIYKYGEERASRRIAKRIIEERTKEPFSNTLRLAEVVRSALPGKRGKIDPATKTFQALRIWVNDELGNLERFLQQSEDLVKPGGRIVIVTFHSLEDSIVKAYFKSNSRKKIARSKYATPKLENDGAIYQLLNNKVVTPSEVEIKRNPRSRSAKLRAAVRLDNNAGGL